MKTHKCDQVEQFQTLSSSEHFLYGHPLPQLESELSSKMQAAAFGYLEQTNSYLASVPLVIASSVYYRTRPPLLFIVPRNMLGQWMIKGLHLTI